MRVRTAAGVAQRLFFAIIRVKIFYADNHSEFCRMKKSYYHIYIKGLERELIFRDRKDYIVGMNYVAVSECKAGVDILAFVLMSNHFHFVVFSTKAEAENFIYMYKSLISRYLCCRYAIKKLLYRVDTNCSLVDTSDEGLKRLIAYVMNNPVKAGVNCLPQNYEWGSGKCYFSSIDYLSDTNQISDLGSRESYRVLRSKAELPDSYRLNSSGYIEPSSYINVGLVERIFKRAKSLEYFLSVSHGRSDSSSIVFSDAALSIMIGEILEKHYDVHYVDELESEELKKMILEFRKQYHCPLKQLARLFNMSLDGIADLLG